MTTRIFNIIFLISIFVILILADYFNKMGILFKFPYIVLMIAYYIGQYSTKFPEKTE